MKLNSKFLTRIIEPALSEFFTSDLSLILNDVAERSLCARLAIHLEKHMQNLGLKGYYADAEYNRKQGGRVKTILSGKLEFIPITCDLIVHSRGEIPQKDNLIALEMAKPNKTQEALQSDRNRLMALTRSSYDGVWPYDGSAHPEHVCGYVKGLYLIIDRHNRAATLEHYAHGDISKPAELIAF